MKWRKICLSHFALLRIVQNFVKNLKDKSASFDGNGDREGAHVYVWSLFFLGKKNSKKSLKNNYILFSNFFILLQSANDWITRWQWESFECDSRVHWSYANCYWLLCLSRACVKAIGRHQSGVRSDERSCRNGSSRSLFEFEGSQSKEKRMIFLQQRNKKSKFFKFLFLFSVCFTCRLVRS